MRAYLGLPKVYAGYGDYRVNTAALGRHIPCFASSAANDVLQHQRTGGLNHLLLDRADLRMAVSAVVAERPAAHLAV